MKKLMAILVLLLLVMLGSASGQTWFTADKLSVEWTAPTTLIDGSPLPTGDVLKYNVYIKDVTNPQAESVALAASELTTQTYTVTFTKEGKFFIGVAALRYAGGVTLVGESAIAWSNNPQYTLNDPFGGVYYLFPSPPTGLKKQ